LLTSCQATRADPRGNWNQRRHHPDERGLARAVRSQQAKNLASFTSNETSSTAVKSPYFFTMCETSIAFGASAGISLLPLNSETEAERH